ncbi:MAG: glycosyltransferase family 2 protein, partial [Bacteroidetes bacterium]|nr:glycosyltransferase family 2 protein [Bacteroidota bacterium]
MSVTNREIDYSIVVPVMNEQENVKRLYSAIKKVMDKLTPAYEIIFIDDGSTDDTYRILESIHNKDSKLKVIKFRGNFGQSPATAAGFELAKGNVIITMDGDLQNDPRDIPNILKKLDEGYDVVSGWRRNRKDKLILRKIPSKVANRIICKVTNVKLHDTGCALKAYRSNIIKKL